jgi:hypothetical protein
MSIPNDANWQARMFWTLLAILGGAMCLLGWWRLFGGA